MTSQAKVRTPPGTASDPVPAASSPLIRLLPIILGLLTLLAFLPAAHNDFVNYDDSDYVTVNPQVQGGFTGSNLFWAFTTGHASNWHPLTWLSHMLDWALFGPKPAGHHIISVLFHVANTVLLFFLLRQMTGVAWRSAMVAALFGLHPLHVESVAWVSERKDVLSTFFFLLATGAYARYCRGSRRTANYALSLVLFAAGLISKPMLVTYPFVLLLLDVWPLRRLRLPWIDAEDSSGTPAKTASLLLEKVPFLAFSLASSMVTFLVQRHGGAVSTTISLGARTENAVVSYARYLGKTFWPNDLSVLYPHPGHWPAWQIAASALLLAGITLGLALLARRRSYALVGWLWFLGTLVPVIGLVQVGIQSMADRYMYIPSIGLFWVLVWGLNDLVPRQPGRERALGFAASVVVALCFGLTVRQVMFWRDSETLFLRAVQVTRDNYLAYNNLGFYMSNRGKAAEAMEYYRKSLAINPQYEDALNNYGYALAGQKRHAEALDYYERALRIRPNHVEVHNNLGNALSELGRIDEAIQHYEFVLQRKPEHADAHNNLGIALAMKGRLDEAIPHFRAAIRSKKDYAGAHSNLGNALAVQQKLDEAIAEYQECLRINPDDPQAHNNLGNALIGKGRLDEAIQQYRRAIQLNANNPEANYNMALALLRQGKAQEARSRLEEAIRLKPDYPEARAQLQALGTGQ